MATTDTLTLGTLTLVGKQQGPCIKVAVRSQIDTYAGDMILTLPEWQSLAALVDVLAAADRRHAEDRAALIAAKEGIERGGDLLKQAQAAMREQAAALDAAIEQRDAARTELRDVTLIKQRITEERDTAVAQLGGYRVLFDEQGRALTKARQEVATMCPVYEAALQWRRELIGERTSYDLRLEAAVDEAAEQAKAKEAKAGDDMLNRRCPVGALCVHEVKCNG